MKLVKVKKFVINRIKVYKMGNDQIKLFKIEWKLDSKLLNLIKNS